MCREQLEAWAEKSIDNWKLFYGQEIPYLDYESVDTIIYNGNQIHQNQY